MQNVLLRDKLNIILTEQRTPAEVQQGIRRECLFCVDRTLDHRVLAYVLTYKLHKKVAEPLGDTPITLYITVNHVRTYDDMKLIPTTGMFQPTIYTPHQVIKECNNHGFSVPMLCPNPLHPANPSFIEIGYSRANSHCYAKTMFPDEYNRQHKQLRIDKFVVTHDTQRGDLNVRVIGKNNGHVVTMPVYLPPGIKQRFHEYNLAASTVELIENIKSWKLFGSVTRNERNNDTS